MENKIQRRPRLARIPGASRGRRPRLITPAGTLLPPAARDSKHALILREDSPAGLCLSDSKGRIVSMSRAAVRLIAAPLGPLRGRRLCDLLCAHPPELSLTCPLSAAPVASRVVVLSKRPGGPLSEGRRRALEIRSMEAPPALAGGGGRLHLIEDATERVEETHCREEWFLRIIHDLATPLTVVESSLGLLAQFSPAPGKVLQTAGTACAWMRKTVRSALDVFRAECGTLPVRPECLDASFLVRECVEMLSVTAEARGVSLASDCPEGLHVLADQDLLRRVLLNLVDNAIKHTPAGGRVFVHGARSRSCVELSIQDNGRGISSDEHSVLFRPFRRTRDSSARGVPGFGVGLAFCRHAMRLMGGDVLLRWSRPGHGSRFSVLLPKPRFDSDGSARCAR